MKSNESPFYLRHLECPVCMTVNEFETIRVGAYVEEGRDTDFCPTQRKWKNPKYDSVNPLLYFMATCVSCFYTRELTAKFREWKDDTTFRTYRQKMIRQKHLSALAENDGPLRRLGSSLWPSSYPTKTAINKLLIGIMDELMLEEPSSLDLGRWYLRIAWLFRESGSGHTPQVSPREQSRRMLHTSLRTLEEGTEDFAARLDAMRSLIENHPETVARAADDHDSPQQCTRRLREIATAFDPVTRSVGELRQWLKSLESQLIGELVEPGTTGYGEFPSYRAFLTALQNDWPAAPRDEIEALGMSLEHYRAAYEAGHGLEAGNAQIQVAYMIGELARRVGDADVADEFLTTAARLGREWIHAKAYDPTQTALARKIVELSLEQRRAIGSGEKSAV